MSRIHEALRRRPSAAAPGTARFAHADAVLASLGYRSEKRTLRGPAVLGIALIAVAAAAAWALWPAREVQSGTRETGGAVRDPIGRASQPVAAPGPRPQPPAVPAPVAELKSHPSVVTVPAAVAGQAPRVVATPPARPSGLTGPSLADSRGQSRAPRVDSRSPGSPKPGSVEVGARLTPRPADPPKPPTGENPGAAPPADPFQLALYYHRAGDFEQALLHYKAALQRDEMNLEAHNNLGSLYLGKGLIDEAVRELQRVVAIDPGYAPARVNLSAALYKLGRFDAAAVQAREALRIDPRNGDGFVNLALAQKASGQPGESRASLRRALEIDAHHAIAHYNLARQYEESGEAVRAVEHYRQFLQYAGFEQEAYAADVRARVRTLQARAVK